jgi:hypothetical protein
MCVCMECWCGLAFFLPRGAWDSRFRLHSGTWLVLPPCHCEARIACDMYECHALDAKGVDFDDDGIEVKLARRGEVSTPVGVSFGVPKLGFWEKNTWIFF